MKRLTLVLVLAVGVALRLGLLLHWPARLNVDEATVGLMALHVLRGEFPVFFLGHAYMGALEAYLASPILLLFGPSAGALKVAVFLFSCLFVAITFLLGRRAAGWVAGLLSALLAALGPPLLPVFGNYPMLGYVETAVVGSLVLLVTLDLALGDGGRPWRARKLGALGLLAGLGWWINPMILSYLAAAGVVLLLLRPGLWRARELWVLPPAFLLGSLPFWLFNLTHAFWSLVMFRKGAEGDVAWGARRAYRMLLNVVGVRGMLTDPVPVLSAAAGLVYLGLLVVLLVGLAWRPRSEGTAAAPRRRAIQLLLLFVFFHLLAFSLSGYAEFAADRYLYPLYSAVPVLSALAVLELWRRARRSRPLAVAAVALLLLNNVLALGKTAQAYEAGRRADWWRPEAVLAFLRAEGLSRAYANQRIAFRLTFETGERIVVVDPFFGERYTPHLEAVDAAPRVAYILSDRLDPTPAQVESSLDAVGARYRRLAIGEFTVLYDFRPAFDGPVTSLPARGWRGQGQPSGSDPGRAFDRDADTAWLSGARLEPEMSYRIDLGETTVVAGITLLPVHPQIGLPRGYRIEVSRDGAAWEPVASVPDFALTLRWRDGQPRPDRSGQVVSRFAPRPTRHVRVVQTGTGREEWWAIAEVFVYAPGGGDAATREAAAAQLREGLRLEKARRWRAAVEAYGRAVRLDPEWEEPHARMVEVFRTAGLPVDGSDPYRRGLVFERLGLWANAARQYETLLGGTLEPDRSAEIQERLREVERRRGTRP